MFLNERANYSQIDRRLIARQQDDGVNIMINELLDADSDRGADPAHPVFISDD
jgi:hypothetical protein